jgi:hypothetical protein
MSDTLALSATTPRRKVSPRKILARKEKRSKRKQYRVVSSASRFKKLRVDASLACEEDWEFEVWGERKELKFANVPGAYPPNHEEILDILQSFLKTVPSLRFCYEKVHATIDMIKKIGDELSNPRYACLAVSIAKFIERELLPTPYCPRHFGDEASILMSFVYKVLRL